jgi:hypothetical protein
LLMEAITREIDFRHYALIHHGGPPVAAIRPRRSQGLSCRDHRTFVRPASLPS